MDTTLFPFIFILALARVAAFVVFLPIENRGMTPNLAKAAIALVLTGVIVPFNVINLPPGLNDPLFFSLSIGAEILFGAFIGFTIQVLFSLMMVAGQMMSQQMGLAMASISDPLTGTQVRVVGVFCNLLGMLFFLAVGGHIVIIRALHQSFSYWPLGTFLSPEFIRDVTVESISRSFLMAFQLAAPVVLMAFTINLSMALLARLVPQINVLIMGFTLRIGAGLIGLTIFLPIIANFISRIFELMYEFLYLIISS